MIKRRQRKTTLLGHTWEELAQEIFGIAPIDTDVGLIIQNCRRTEVEDQGLLWGWRRDRALTTFAVAVPGADQHLRCLADLAERIGQKLVRVSSKKDRQRQAGGGQGSVNPLIALQLVEEGRYEDRIALHAQRPLHSNHRRDTGGGQTRPERGQGVTRAIASALATRQQNKARAGGQVGQASDQIAAGEMRHLILTIVEEERGHAIHQCAVGQQIEDVVSRTELCADLGQTSMTRRGQGGSEDMAQPAQDSLLLTDGAAITTKVRKFPLARSVTGCQSALPKARVRITCSLKAKG